MDEYLVWITPASGVGGEFPIPVIFRNKSKRYVKAYARECREIGQKVRIERVRRDSHRPVGGVHKGTLHKGKREFRDGK